MTAFTPGPWETVVGARNSEARLVIQTATPRTKGRHYTIASAYASMGSDAQANAHLIAAAPELYGMTDLLERCLVYEIKKSEHDGDDEGARLKLFTLAEVRTLLNKARGGVSPDEAR